MKDAILELFGLGSPEAAKKKKQEEKEYQEKVQNYKNILNKIGARPDSNSANIEIINPKTNIFEVFYWRYLIPNDPEHQTKVVLFKQVVKILEELNNCINLNSPVSPKF